MFETRDKTTFAGEVKVIMTDTENVVGGKWLHMWG